MSCYTDALHEECGVFGILEPKTTDVAHTAYLALYALQHRGQEACGIVVNDDGVFTHHKGDGLVHEVFPEGRLNALGKGNMAVGHVRYSTTGGKSLSNIQPLVIRHIKGNMALAHNGNLVNAAELRKQFELAGGIFHGTSDTEAIAYTIVSHRLHSASTAEAIEKTMASIRGAYSCIVMTATRMIAFRDPNGFRPLCIGRTARGAWVVSSESCALDHLRGRDRVGPDPLPSKRTAEHLCVRIYLFCPFRFRGRRRVRARRTSEGRRVSGERAPGRRRYRDRCPGLRSGRRDGLLDAAMGYAKESGIPYGVGFIKNRYIGRSFIEPTQGQREDTVRIKLNVLRETVAGKRVIMIDDSIVRGTTCARIVELLREAGAKEVHMRVSSPPFRHACYFGTDVDSRDKLIACRYDTVEEIAREIGVDSLGYLSLEATHRIAEQASVGFCDGCFTGHYPIPVPEEIEKNKFDQKLGSYK